jgi:2'-5' RNA ligase
MSSDDAILTMEERWVLDEEFYAEPFLTTVAAGDVAISGAMIALVPTADDAARLVIGDGEAVEQLHLTLLFLGDDASMIDETTRGELKAWAQATAGNWSSVEGRAFAPALFNPDGEDPCAVLVCSGEDLAEIHDTALADISEIVDLPDQHQPFIPHITLVYLESDTVDAALDQQWSERVGPVVFDRLRLAFADEVFDVPFGSFDESPQPAEVATVVAATLPEREAWDGCPRGFHPAHTGACPPAL